MPISVSPNLIQDINNQPASMGAYAQESKDLEVQQQMEWERLRRFRDDNDARSGFSQAIFIVTVMWMFAVLWIVVENGSGKLHFSDTVLVTLITTTTANVFGFFYVVVNYLFNKDRST